MLTLLLSRFSARCGPGSPRVPSSNLETQQKEKLLKSSNRSLRIESHWLGLDYMPLPKPMAAASRAERANWPVLNHIRSPLPESWSRRSPSPWAHRMTVGGSGCPKWKQRTVTQKRGKNARHGEKTCPALDPRPPSAWSGGKRDIDVYLYLSVWDRSQLI